MAEVTGARQMSNVDEKAAKLERRLQEWKKVRQRGKYLYILRWGCFYSIINACGDIFSYKYHYLSFPKINLYTVVYYSAIWLLLGFFFALFMWLVNDDRYLRALKKQDSIRDDSKAQPDSRARKGK